MELTPKPPTKRLTRYTKRLLDQSLRLYEAAIRIANAESNRQMVSASEYFRREYESMPMKALLVGAPFREADCNLASECAELLESIQEVSTVDRRCLVGDLTLIVRTYSRQSDLRNKLHALLGVT